MANTSIYAAFERFWQHTVSKLNGFATTEVLDTHVADTSNPHNVTKTQVGLSNVDNTSDADKPVSTAQQSAIENAVSTAKSYTDTAVSGLASTTSVTNAISTHNTSTEAHNDIRTLISDLSTKVNNFLDVDDTTTDQLSEVLAMIEANEGTIESLTSNKINVSDIIDNLTTASADKVLSANQGVVLKGLIDALQEVVNGKANASHSHEISDITNLQSALDNKANSSHTHSDATASTSGFMSATDKAKLDSITEAKVASWDAAVAQAHEHSNKTVIDGITAEDVATWNTVESKAAQTDIDAAIERIAQNETDISSLTSSVNTKAETSDLNTAITRIAKNENDIASLVSTVGSLSPITSEEVSALFA